MKQTNTYQMLPIKRQLLKYNIMDGFGQRWALSESASGVVSDVTKKLLSAPASRFPNRG